MRTKIYITAEEKRLAKNRDKMKHYEKNKEKYKEKKRKYYQYLAESKRLRAIQL